MSEPVRTLVSPDWRAAAVAWARRAESAEAALRKIAAQQPETIAWLRANEIVFDGPLGADPSNWQHVAFSIYTDLCETDAIARAALALDAVEEAAVGPAPTTEGFSPIGESSASTAARE